MILEIISDYSCPFCYLGELRLQKVLKDLNAKIEIKHTSFQLDKSAPKTTTLNAYEAFANKYEVDVEVAKQQMRPLEEKAHSMNCVINFSKVQPTNTLLAHRFAKAYENKTKDASIHLKLYQAYFEKGYNLSDQNDLFKIAQDCGISETEFKELIDDSSTLVACLNDFKLNKQKQVQGIPQLFYRSERLVRGLVEEEIYKEKITTAYLKMMENQ